MAQQITKVRQPDGTVLRLADWTSSDPLYSTVEVAAGAFTVLQAFSYGLGGAVPGSATARNSDRLDTNLRGQGGKLPEDEALMLHGLAIEAFTVGVQDGGAAYFPVDDPHVSVLNMVRLQRDVIVTTRISAVKEYTRHPLSWFPVGSGVTEVNSLGLTDGGVNGFAVANNGGDTPDDQRNFASPLLVQGGDPFTVDFTAGPGQVTGLDFQDEAGRIALRVTCNGPRKRPIA